jgi:hypothetical protein
MLNASHTRLTSRLIGSERIWERGAALTSRLQSFATELLTQEESHLTRRRFGTMFRLIWALPVPTG